MEVQEKVYKNNTIYTTPESRAVHYLTLRNGFKINYPSQYPPEGLPASAFTVDLNENQYVGIAAFSYFTYYSNDREDNKRFRSKQEFFNYAKNKSPGALLEMTSDPNDLRINSILIHQDGPFQSFYIQATKPIKQFDQILVYVGQDIVPTFTVSDVQVEQQNAQNLKRARSPGSPSVSPPKKVQMLGGSTIQATYSNVIKGTPISRQESLNKSLVEVPSSIDRSFEIQRIETQTLHRYRVRDDVEMNPELFEKEALEVSIGFEDMVNRNAPKSPDLSSPEKVSPNSSFVLRLSPSQRLTPEEEEKERPNYPPDSPYRSGPKSPGLSPIKRSPRKEETSSDDSVTFHIESLPFEFTVPDTSKSFKFTVPDDVKNVDSTPGDEKITEAQTVIPVGCLTPTKSSRENSISSPEQPLLGRPLMQSTPYRGGELLPHRSQSPRSPDVESSPIEGMVNEQNFKSDEWETWFDQTLKTYSREEGEEKSSKSSHSSKEESVELTVEGEGEEEINTTDEPETEVDSEPEKLNRATNLIDLTLGEETEERPNKPALRKKRSQSISNFLVSNRPNYRETLRNANKIQAMTDSSSDEAVKITVPRNSIVTITISDSEEEQSQTQRLSQISMESIDIPFNLEEGGGGGGGGVEEDVGSPVKQFSPVSSPRRFPLSVETISQEAEEREGQKNALEELKNSDRLSNAEEGRRSSRVNKGVRNFGEPVKRMDMQIIYRPSNLEPSKSGARISIHLSKLRNRNDLVCSIRKSNEMLQRSATSGYQTLTFQSIDKILLCLVQKFNMNEHARFIDLGSGYGNIVFQAALMYKLAAAHGVDIGLQGDYYDVGNQRIFPLDKITYYCSILTNDVIKRRVPQVAPELEKVLFYFGDANKLALKDYTHLVSFNTLWDTGDFHGLMGQLLAPDSKMVVFGSTKDLHGLKHRVQTSSVTSVDVEADKTLIQLIKDRLHLAQTLVINSPAQQFTMHFYVKNTERNKLAYPSNMLKSFEQGFDDMFKSGAKDKFDMNKADIYVGANYAKSVGAPDYINVRMSNLEVDRELHRKVRGASEGGGGNSSQYSQCKYGNTMKKHRQKTKRTVNVQYEEDESSCSIS